MMKTLKKAGILLLSAALLAGCGSQKQVNDDKLPIEDISASAALKEKDMMGLSLLLPEDMLIDTDDEGDLFAVNEAGTATVYVSEYIPSEDQPKDYDKESFEKMLLDSFHDIKVLDFAADVKVDDNIRMDYAQMSMLNNLDDSQDMAYIYIFFFDTGVIQFVELMYKEGADSSLEQNIDEIRNSMTFGDAFN